jgi:hypothetical protein
MKLSYPLIALIVLAVPGYGKADTPFEFPAAPGDEGGMEEDLALQRLTGSAGDIVGEWSLEFGPNFYTLTFNPDGTFFLNGALVVCEDE